MPKYIRDDIKSHAIDENIHEVEISLLEIMQTIYRQRKRVFFFLLGGLIFGICYAFLFNPNEYSSRAVMLPISNSIETGTSGLLKQFGKLGGISIGGSSSAEGIPPGLYPNVVNSTPFLFYISEQKINLEESDSLISVFDYFDRYYNSGLSSFVRLWTIELPDRIMEMMRESGQENIVELSSSSENTPIKLTKRHQNVLNALNDRITVELDEEVGIVDLNVKMPEPTMTAEIAMLTLNYLTEYSIAFKTDKERANQKFIQGRYNEAKNRFYEAQEKLALFNDRNQNLTQAKAQANRERLEAEYNLTFNLYNGLSQQLEESKIKVQEETPAFKILEPVQVPINKSSPRKLLLIILFGIVGLILGLFWALYGAYIKNFLSQIVLKNGHKS